MADGIQPNQNNVNTSRLPTNTTLLMPTTHYMATPLGLCRLCQHNFQHNINRGWKA